jgi:hypothetical protein
MGPHSMITAHHDNLSMLFIGQDCVLWPAEGLLSKDPVTGEKVDDLLFSLEEAEG